MPTWGAILTELEATITSERPAPDFDSVRRKYLARLQGLNPDRAVIAYYSGFLEGGPSSPDLQINLLDVQGMMEIVSNIPQRQCDLILHSPGGLAEGAEQVLLYLRTRFDHIRAVVPLVSMSAGTMLALGCDEIVMGAHSQLGPIDPQFQIMTADGPRAAPAEAILDQFELAKREIRDSPASAGAWLPILSGYGPGLLAQCEDQRELGKELVKGWLMEYMLRADPQAEEKAAAAVEFFAAYGDHKTHGRPIRRERAEALGLSVRNLEQDQDYQDAVLSVHHCFMHTLGGAPVSKLIENHTGRAFVRMSRLAGQFVIGGPAPTLSDPRRPPAPVTPAVPTPQLPRAERRRRERGQR